MPLASIGEILVEARKRRYGVLSLLAGNLEMVIGQISAAEELRAPLILAFSQELTPQVPLELAMPCLVHAARRARVPVATILDHGRDLETIVRAIHLGTSSVMFDGSALPYEENVRSTREVVRIAHAVGVSVEAELGTVVGSAGDAGSEASGTDSVFTDPELAADFVQRTDVDTLAISFGNVHGRYQGSPRLDLHLLRRIHSRVAVPLAMHGASGLADTLYREIVASGISKVCYYTAAGIRAASDLGQMLAQAGQDQVCYHEVIARAVTFFREDTKNL
ncbi:MAG: class II fructose-bisphosphate aldolase, partial [Anaerolineae bacterium]|nr:class II fructose-bisphosphate aldolase [Anaerolineae bacterium]